MGDGLRRLSESERASAIAAFEAASVHAVKFVPASGAASRMFKELFDALPTADGAALPNKAAREFFGRVRDFAFADDLDKALGGALDALVAQQKWSTVLRALLLGEHAGLDYGEQPKGLLRFHRYGGGGSADEVAVRTPLDEHLVEGAAYSKGRDGVVRVHFTVSPHHMDGFRAQMAAVRAHFERVLQCAFDVSYSVQKESTDTIAVTPDNQPFRLADGSLLFRPAGHGALIENLNDIRADIVFIKNIDNVVPDALKPTTIEYKKVLAGVLLQERERIARFVQQLRAAGAGASAALLHEAAEYVATALGHRAAPGAVHTAASLLKLLERPLRVCGMVANTGEPGGGPFWVRGADGSQSLQVVESAQMNLKDERQAAVFKAATHFNPVDLVCSAKAHDGSGSFYSLLEHRDLSAGFIASKSQEGRELKAQELPGLWNGAMADWSTVFVEVPLITFNPVKTVIDLLRKEHQPQQ